jgi:hypothetical protein
MLIYAVDCDRKYATRPVMVKAADICIYRLLKSVDVSDSVTVFVDV